MTDLSTAQSGLLRPAMSAVALSFPSVGHGGTTSWLAVMALRGVATAEARSGVRFGTLRGGFRWHTDPFHLGLAAGFWTLAGKLILTGK